MAKKEAYPYQQPFRRWCLELDNYHRTTKNTFDKYISPTINTYWIYYQTNSPVFASVDNIKEQDIRDYLDYLENTRKLTSRTINKQLAHLHKYFNFLYDYHYIKADPTHEVMGRKWGRHRKIIVNWDKCIPGIVAKHRDLSQTSIYLLIAIVLGYKPEELSDLLFQEFMARLENSKFPAAFVQQIRNTQLNGQIYLFESRKTHRGMELISIKNTVRKDSAKIHLHLTPNLLRASLILQAINERTHSDQELSRRFDLTYAQIDYYHTQLLKWYTLIDYQDWIKQLAAKDNKQA